MMLADPSPAPSETRGGGGGRLQLLQSFTANALGQREMQTALSLPGASLPGPRRATGREQGGESPSLPRSLGGSVLNSVCYPAGMGGGGVGCGGKRGTRIKPSSLSQPEGLFLGTLQRRSRISYGLAGCFVVFSQLLPGKSVWRISGAFE